MSRWDQLTDKNLQEACAQREILFSKRKDPDHVHPLTLPLPLRCAATMPPKLPGVCAMMEGPRITTTVNRCSMVGLAAEVQRIRADEFGRDLFTIPAFEMLLDLYTRPGSQPRSLTSLTAASSASERNSQRIVHRLAARGMVEMRRDPADGRRILVDLTVQAAQMLDRFFDRMVLLAGELPLHGNLRR